MPPSFFGPHEIFSLLSHHPARFDATLLSISTERDSGKPNTIDSKFYPCATLGDLEVLPVELLNETLRYSDLRSFHVTIARNIDRGCIDSLQVHLTSRPPSRRRT
jgi:hypothetical protein